MADTYDYDVLIIGSGPGGYVAAIRAAQLGLKTACVESRETLGGTCLNVGCIPSKAMLHASEYFDAAKNGMMAKMGVEVTPKLNLAAMHDQRIDAVKQLTGGIAFLFKKNKVDWIKGFASFKDAHTVEVNGETITAKEIVIATGSSVTPLPGVEVDNAKCVVVDSDRCARTAQGAQDDGRHRRRRDRARTRLASGGGSARRSSWSNSSTRSCPAWTRTSARKPTRSSRSRASTFKLGTKVTGCTVKGKKATLTMEPAAGGDSETLEADCVLVSIGRKPNTEGLGLDTIGLETNKRGQIEVDGEFRTSVDGVRAIGDVIPGPMLAHKAEDEGIAVAEWIAGQTGIVNHAVIPSVVYTWPEIAGVGLTEEQAKDAGRDQGRQVPDARQQPRQDQPRARRFRESDLGGGDGPRARRLGHRQSVAGTMIAEAALAMEFGATSEDIAYTCHAHPTHSEALKEAAMAVQGKPIHV